MFNAKLAALCLCPALVATPAVIATHPKMRHAVAHIIHRAANRIDTAPAETASAAPSTYCPPTYAAAGPGGSGVGNPLSNGPAGLSPLDTSAVQTAVLQPATGRYAVFPGPDTFNNAPLQGIGGNGPPPAPGTGLVTTPVATEGVPEPQNWALLMTGFATTGVLLRNRRLRSV